MFEQLYAWNEWMFGVMLGHCLAFYGLCIHNSVFEVLLHSWFLQCVLMNAWFQVQHMTFLSRRAVQMQILDEWKNVCAFAVMQVFCVRGRKGSDSVFFVKQNNQGLLQQITVYIPRGTLPYVVTAQHGIPGTAQSDDLSLLYSHLTAKNCPSLTKSQSLFSLIFLVYKLHVNTWNATSKNRSPFTPGLNPGLQTRNIINSKLLTSWCIMDDYAQVLII